MTGLSLGVRRRFLEEGSKLFFESRCDTATEPRPVGRSVLGYVLQSLILMSESDTFAETGTVKAD